MCLLSSPRKGPAGPWTQGKLVLSPAWERAVYSLKTGRDGAELAGSAAQAAEVWAAALCSGRALLAPSPAAFVGWAVNRAIPHQAPCCWGPQTPPNHPGEGKSLGLGSCPLVHREKAFTSCRGTSKSEMQNAWDAT